MKLPAFLKQNEERILYNGTGELIYYIPERYFTDSKTTIAAILGSYVSTMGVFDWALMYENGKVGPAKCFKYPTIFKCQPSKIEKVKDLSLNGLEKKDYRVLHFVKGDEAISDINIPKLVENAELLYNIMVTVENRMPCTIPYDKLQGYFPDNMSLNTNGYGLSMQLFGMMISELCRDPEDITKPFRLSVNQDKPNYLDYTAVSIKKIPKYTSAYTAITSENADEAIAAALTTKGNTESPLEKVVMGS
jgi:hypothetical protein